MPYAREDVAGDEKQHGLGEGVIHSVEHGAEDPGAAQADAQGEDAHVLDAGVGEEAFEIGLPDDERGRHGHGNQSEADEQRPGKVAKPGGGADLLHTNDAKKRAVQEGAGQQRRDDWG